MTGVSTPPIDIHEGRVARHTKRDKGREPIANAAINRMVKAGAMARANANLAHDLALKIKADKSFMGSRAAVKFPEDAKALFNATDKAISEAMSAALAEHDRLSKLVRPAVLADKSLATEIRSKFEKLNPDQRAAALEDDTVAAAVMNAPAFLSGLGAAERDIYSQQWAKKKFPDEVEELQAITKSLSDLREVGVSAEKYLGELVRVMATPATETSVRTKAAQDAAVAAATAE